MDPAPKSEENNSNGPEIVDLEKEGIENQSDVDDSNFHAMFLHLRGIFKDDCNQNRGDDLENGGEKEVNEVNKVVGSPGNVDEVVNEAVGSPGNADLVVNEVGGNRRDGEENEMFNNVRVIGGVHNDTGIEYLNTTTVEGGRVHTDVQTEEYHVLDVPELSDNEDEETVEARKNLQNFIASQTKLRTDGGQLEGGVEVGSSSATALGPTDIQGEIDDDRAFQSDDDVSYITTSDEDDSEAEHDRRRKARHPAFKEVEDWPVICVGMAFRNKEQFKKAVDKLSFKEGREIKWVKNDKVRLRAICKEAKKRSCKWKILLAKDTLTETWIVKTFNQEHTCIWSVENKRFNSSLAAKYLVNSRGASCLHMNCDDIFEAIRNEKDIELTSVQCKKTKLKLKKTFEGTSEAEYGMLFDYANELRSKDPEANIVLQAHRPTADVNPTFMRMYVCFGGLKKGFLAGCRRIIGVNGAFLKGAHKGELLTAVGRDANDQMFPIAWAIVEVEKTETWLWFFEELQKDLQIGDGGKFCIMSDQQKGLIQAVEEIFPLAEHRFCARHKFCNFRKKNKGKELQAAFWKCVKSNTVAEFNKALEELTKLKPSARDDLLNSDPKHWCRAFFNTDTNSDIVDNNMCEVFNGLLVDARQKSIISMNQDLRRFCGKRTVARREYAESKFVADFGPKIWEKIITNVRGSRRCRLSWPGGKYYEITEDGTKGFVIDLENRKCTCRFWDLTGIPCKHAVTVINAIKQKVEDYVANCYKKDAFLASYQFEVPAIEGISQWEKTGLPPIQPPVARKLPGRPKKKRVLEEWEGQSKMSRRGRPMTCQQCFKKGHNSRSCKEQGPITAPQNENGNEQQIPITEAPNPPSASEGQVANSGTLNLTTVDEIHDSQIPVSQVVTPTQEEQTPVEQPTLVQQPIPIQHPTIVQQSSKRVKLPVRRKQQTQPRAKTSSEATETTHDGTLASKVTPVQSPTQSEIQIPTQHPNQGAEGSSATGPIPFGATNATEKPPRPSNDTRNEAKDKQKKPTKAPFVGIGTYINDKTGLMLLNPGHVGSRVLNYGDAYNKRKAKVQHNIISAGSGQQSSGIVNANTQTSGQFVTARQLQAQVEQRKKARQEEKEKNEEALGRWNDLFSKVTSNLREKGGGTDFSQQK